MLKTVPRFDERAPTKDELLLRQLRGRMPDQVLVFLPDPLEQSLVRELLGRGDRVHLCSNWQEAIATIAVAAPSVIVWDLTPVTSRCLWQIIEYCWTTRQAMPRLLLLASLESLPFNDIVVLARRYPHAKVSLRGLDEFPTDLARLSVVPMHDADLIIVNRLSECPLTPGLQIVIGIAIVGDKRMEVRRITR